MISKTLSVKKLKCFYSNLVGYSKCDHAPGHFARGTVALPPSKDYPSGELSHSITEVLNGFNSEYHYYMPCHPIGQRPAFTTPDVTAGPRSPQPWTSLSK